MEECDPKAGHRPTRKEWGVVYLEWRKQHLHWTPAQRGRIVRGCWGKQAFDGFMEAAWVVSRLEPRPGVKAGCYICEICKKWHVGNSRFKK